MVDCQCIRPFKMVFGIPVLLTVKLIPKSFSDEFAGVTSINSPQNIMRVTKNVFL